MTTSSRFFPSTARTALACLTVFGVFSILSTPVFAQPRFHGPPRPYHRPSYHHHHHHSDGAAAAYAVGSFLNFAATVHAINNQPDVVVVERPAYRPRPAVVVERPIVVERPVVVERSVIVEQPASPQSVFDRGSNGVSGTASTGRTTSLVPSRTQPQPFYSQKLGANFLVQKMQIPGAVFTAVRLMSDPVDGSPLQNLGLRKGDVVTRIGGTPCDHVDALESHEGVVEIRYIKTGTTKVLVSRIAIPSDMPASDDVIYAP